jgi:hypothetical protein
MKVSRREFMGAAAIGLTAAQTAGAAATAARKRGPSVPLFNGRNLDGWYSYLRPIGKNTDPDGIFKVENGLIHILGKNFGYLATNEEFDDFHLSVEFKWGEKKFPPRLNAKRDSGILYRFPADKEDKVWPYSIECQVQEGDCGDFWMIGGTSVVVDGVTHLRFIQKKRDAEKPNGQWNRIEIVADGDRCTHVVNGVVVNEAAGANVAKGRIVLQSEGAEVFYRKVEVRRLVD